MGEPLMDEQTLLRRMHRFLTCLLAGAVLAGCASSPRVDEDIAGSPWAQQSQAPQPQRGLAWQHHPLPGKAATEFRYTRHDSRDALAVRADASASLMRYPVRVAPEDLGRLRFSWKVPGLIDEADLASRSKDDSPVRVILAFEGDRTRLSVRDLALSELARTLTGEEMPYATLMYVWCNKRPAGTVVHSPRTDRIRSLVVESGAPGLNRWLDYERDVRADYERAFGEKPGALIGVAIMTDSDNTQSQARAWYGPVRFVGAPAAAGR